MKEERRNNPNQSDRVNPLGEPRSKQEQSDPQHTELRGFVDPSEDLEPTLTDGTKAPDKAEEENSDYRPRK